MANCSEDKSLASAPLRAFEAKLKVLRSGREPPLTSTERKWLIVLRKVATEFPAIPRDESDATCMQIIWKCIQLKNGKEHNYKYLLTACRNAHRDTLRAMNRRKRRERRLSKDVGSDPWVKIDTRIDIEDALVKMKRLNPDCERALRMRRQLYDNDEIANALGVCQRKAEAMVAQAKTLLKQLLGEAYDRQK